jgi:hypothetical protein
LELLAAVSVTWSSLIFAMLDYPALIRTMVAALVPGFSPGTTCAGQTGLEPATCGFGDRCATNCATTLWSEFHRNHNEPPACTGAHVIIRVSTPENQSTQQLRVRKTSPVPALHAALS